MVRYGGAGQDQAVDDWTDLEWYGVVRRGGRDTVGPEG
jgi:hypothetical protein